MLRSLVLCLIPLIAAAAPAPQDDVQRLIALVEYIGGDYGGAVEGGKVVSQAEYQEMTEFSAKVVRAFAPLKSRFAAETGGALEANVKLLESLIGAKADATAVGAQARSIRNRILDELKVDTAPTAVPDLGIAEKTYGTTCANCHGAAGKGDGPGGKGLEPLPRNFHEDGVVESASPFKFYNTLLTGVEGTGMISYAKALDDAALWSLAFQAIAFPSRAALEGDAALPPAALWAKLPAPTRAALTKGGLSLALLSRMNFGELEAWTRTTLASERLDAKAIKRTTHLLRAAAPFLKETPKTASLETPAQVVPPKVDEAPEPNELASALARTTELVAAARTKFAAGDAAGAENALFDAYLNGYEKLETTLRIKDSAHVTRAEQDFIAAREQARNDQKEGFAQAMAKLDLELVHAATLLAPKSGAPSVEGGTGDFFTSFVIILREGFEAFLIVGAILTLLTKSGVGERKRWIHVGWISAVVAGFATYFIFIKAMSITGATRETVEAVSTGIAAVVLFYVSFWLLNQAERSRWDGFLKRSGKSLAGAGETRTVALFFLAFIAVYREAAETVLFYAALTSSAASVSAVGAGFVAGSLVLFVLCWAIMKLGVRLPLRQFFLVTSSLMIVISIVLAGKAVKELIEAGYVTPTTLPWAPTIDALGMYHYVESMGAQAFAALVAVILVGISVRTARIAAPRAVAAG